MHREREAGQKVCLKCFVTTTVNRFHYYFFRLSQKGRNEKRESFYTAKRVSSVHSRRDETRLAVFSVPFPQNKFRTCFFLRTKMQLYYSQADGIPQFINMMEDAQKKAKRAGMPIADVELVMLASAAVLAAQHFPRKVDD